MNRREFITLLGGAAAVWPLAARAQQPEPMRRIGVLMSVAAEGPEGQARLAAFLKGLEQLGWTVGRNREFITLLGGAAACSRRGRNSPERIAASLSAFLEGVRTA